MYINDLGLVSLTNREEAPALGRPGCPLGPPPGWPPHRSTPPIIGTPDVERDFDGNSKIVIEASVTVRAKSGILSVW